MSRIKIALVGKARSGKDTVAYYLEREYATVNYAFGDELKRQFHEDYPYIDPLPKPVRGYQLYGQLKRYTEGEDVWVDACFERIEEDREEARAYEEFYSYHEHRPVITDVRQKNELETCKRKGYTIVKIESREDLRIQRMEEEGDNYSNEVLNYETETELDSFPYDMVIYNNGTIQELYDQIDEVILRIQKESKDIQTSEELSVTQEEGAVPSITDSHHHPNVSWDPNIYKVKQLDLEKGELYLDTLK